MDRNWTHRGMPYKACLVSLLIGVCPFLMGFGAPDWLWFSYKGENGTEVDGSYGLWELCLGTECASNPIFGNRFVGDWFLTVVIFQALALPFYITSLVLAILQNFTPRRWIRTLGLHQLRQFLHRDSETPEDLAFVAGFLSFVGIIVFMIITSDVVSRGAYYSWGFAMSFTGASILVITGVLMCKAHSPTFNPQPLPPEPRLVRTFQATPGRSSRNLPSPVSTSPAL